MDTIYIQLVELYNIWRKIELQYDLYARRLGMAPNSMKVLYYIYKGQKVCTQQILCEKTKLPKQTIHSVILNFIKDGTIELYDDPDNKKSKLIKLTTKGRDFCIEAFNKLDKSEYNALAFFSEDDRYQLLCLLREYEQELEKNLRE